MISFFENLSDEQGNIPLYDEQGSEIGHTTLEDVQVVFGEAFGDSEAMLAKAVTEGWPVWETNLRLWFDK